MMGLQFILYDRDYTTILDDITSKQSGANIVTALPGGFLECEFDLACGDEEAWKWYYGDDGAGRFNCYLKVHDLGQVVWEGRISQIGFKPRGLHILAEGYWRNLFDIPYSNLAVAEDTTRRIAHYDGTANMINDILTASCAQIGASRLNITANALLAPRYLEDYQLPGDLFVEYCRYGDVNFYPYEFAVWEDRELHYGPRGYVPWGEDAGAAPPTFTEREPDWIISKRDLGIGDEDIYLNRALEDMWNECVAEYEAANHEYALTGLVSDADSIARYGLTRRQVLSLGWTLPTLADDATERFVEELKDAPQKAEFSIIGKVFDMNGVPKDPWWVRAGHIIRVRDLVPEEFMYQDPILDKLTTFVIQETSCSTEDMTLEITPFYSPDRLTSIMALIDLLGSIGED